MQLVSKCLNSMLWTSYLLSLFIGSFWPLIKTKSITSYQITLIICMCILLKMKIKFCVNWHSFSTDKHTTGRICEDDAVHLNCRHGRLSITRAFYGATPDNPCSGDRRNCGLDVKSNIAWRCKGQSCSLKASNTFFGDPCHGTRKYLLVTYDCIEGLLRKQCNFGDLIWHLNINCFYLL